MQVRRPLAASLLLLTAIALPPLFGLAVHELAHHEHAEEAGAGGVDWSGLAGALVHGHDHGDGVPDHEHELLPSPQLRMDALRAPLAPVLAALGSPVPQRPLLASDRPWTWGRRELAGSSPPRLQLLCTLLI